VSCLKSTILAKDEEIERLQALKGLSGSRVKRNLIPRSRSSIQLQSANPPPIDDPAPQSDFVATTAENSGCTDSDFDGRSSDFSDSGFAAGTETDGSESSSLAEVPKQPSEKM